MTEPDTTWLRSHIEPLGDYDPVSLGAATVRALCDGYDEAQRLREAWAEFDEDHVAAFRRGQMRARTFADYASERAEAERDAARQALADLIGELWGLCDGDPDDEAETTWVRVADLRAVIDPYDPDLFQCVHCEQYRDVEERHGGRDTDPGYYCDACMAGP